MPQKIERYNYKKVHALLDQSEEILMRVKIIVPTTKTLLYRNFLDFELPQIETKTSNKSSIIKIVSAGLLGVARGILKL